MFGPSRSFSPPGTMASVDFSQFVVTAFPFEYVYSFPPVRPPRVLTRSFPPSTCRIYPRAIPCSYWASTCSGALPSLRALYAISVRQARGLPIERPFNSQNPASFRFCLATDTLAFGCILPTAGRIGVFHPLERALTGRTENRECLCLRHSLYLQNDIS